MHYQTNFKGNPKPSITRKPVLVKDYLALSAEYDKLLEIHTAHQCPKCKDCSKFADTIDKLEKEKASAMQSIASYRKRQAQDSKQASALRKTIASLERDKVTLHDQAFEAKDNCIGHENQLRIFAKENKTLLETRNYLATENANLESSMSALAKEAEQMEAEIQALKDAQFTFKKFGAAIASPFVKAYNYVKGLWA